MILIDFSLIQLFCSIIPELFWQGFFEIIINKPATIDLLYLLAQNK